MVTRDEVLRFFEAKGIPPECPACGKNDWYLPGSEEDFSAALLMPRLQGDPLKNFRGHIPVVHMICVNCGHVRMHAKAVVLRFTRAQQNQRSVDDGG